MDQEVCKNPECGKPILVMAFRGTGVCSIDCRKVLGLDTSSVGTMMHVTTEEKRVIEEARSLPGGVLTNKIATKKSKGKVNNHVR